MCAMGGAKKFKFRHQNPQEYPSMKMREGRQRLTKTFTGRFDSFLAGLHL